MNFLPANRLRLYRNFKSLESADFHGIVRFYEQYEDGIRALDFDEFLECTLVYANALFETGQHGKHLVMSDHLLEIIIMQNVESWGGEDLYERVLFRKAISLFQLEEYPKAIHVLRELVKIAPDDPMPRRFLEKCLLRQKPGWLMKTRAAFIAFSLLAALVVAFEIFVIEPFFDAWLRSAQIAHNMLLCVAVATLLVGESLHGWRCKKAVTSIAAQRRRGLLTNESTRLPK